VHPLQTIVAAGQGGRGQTAAGICIYDTTATATATAAADDSSNELAPVCELILSITGHKVCMTRLTLSIGDPPLISSLVFKMIVTLLFLVASALASGTDAYIKHFVG
jgi:hypothetical protein